MYCNGHQPLTITYKTSCLILYIHVLLIFIYLFSSKTTPQMPSFYHLLCINKSGMTEWFYRLILISFLLGCLINWPNYSFTHSLTSQKQCLQHIKSATDCQIQFTHVVSHMRWSRKRVEMTGVLNLSYTEAC